MSDKNAQADPFGSQKSQDSYLEGLLKLKESDPAKYKELSPAVKMSVGYYEEKKQKERLNEK